MDDPTYCECKKETPPTLVDANRVANYFIYKSHTDGEPISAIKLQRLVYYAQAWHLVLENSKLVEDTFYAWEDGPRCTKLHKRFYQEETEQWKPIERTFLISTEGLSIENVEFLDKVWNAYGAFNGIELGRIVRSESPWFIGYYNLFGKGCEISIDDMYRFYHNKLKEDENLQKTFKN